MECMLPRLMASLKKNYCMCVLQQAVSLEAIISIRMKTAKSNIDIIEMDTGVK